jgi:hypothetical protein
MSDEVVGTTDGITAGFFEIAVGDMENVPELKLLQDGEAQLRIESAEVKRFEKNGGGNYIAVRYRYLDDPNIADIRDNIFLASPQMKSQDERRYNSTMRRLRDFCQAFRVDTTQGGIVIENLAGLTGWALVGTQAATAQYEASNNIRKYTVGR